MTKQKTIPELQAEIAANERQLAQLQHKQQQLENRRSYYEKGDRRKRAHRLITRGAAIYFNFVGRFVPPAFGEVEFAEQVFALTDTQRLLTKTVRDHAGGG